MPELPEVEVIRGELEDFRKSFLKPLRITEVRSIFNDQEFTPLIGLEWKAIFRRGKRLFFAFEKNYYLLVHLRLNGNIFIARGVTLYDYPPFFLRFFIFFLKFKNDYALSITDSRKFAQARLVKSQRSLLDLKEWRDIGVDFLSDIVTPAWLFQIFQQEKKRVIKVVLLDQSKFSGVGNIYACEILFKSRISPLCLARELSFSEVEAIVNFGKKIILKAINKKGTSIFSFRNPSGTLGGYQRELFVYARNNKPCRCCGNYIKRLKQAGRFTYYCSFCQT